MGLTPAKRVPGSLLGRAGPKHRETLVENRGPQTCAMAGGGSPQPIGSERTGQRGRNADPNWETTRAKLGKGLELSPGRRGRGVERGEGPRRRFSAPAGTS